MLIHVRKGKLFGDRPFPKSEGTVPQGILQNPVYTHSFILTSQLQTEDGDIFSCSTVSPTKGQNSRGLLVWYCCAVVEGTCILPGAAQCIIFCVM